jgi:RimJ/RimL family protein N-acetyltransferase
MRQKAKAPAQSSGKRSLQRGCGRRVPFVVLGPGNGALTGDFMFPDLARDDVFRLETPRLWLRWPRICDANALQRFCSRWEVARYTARIPHPYPGGSAERFIYAAREANSAGRDLTLVMTPIRGNSDAIGSISLESRGGDRLALGFALAPEAWGKGLATEAAEAIIDAAFGLTPTVEILASVRVENQASKAVLEKCGFAVIGTGLQGAPARGGLVECHSLRLTRVDWTSFVAPRREAPDALSSVPSPA